MIFAGWQSVSEFETYRRRECRRDDQIWPVPIRPLLRSRCLALRAGFNPWPTALGGTFYAAIRFDLSLIGPSAKGELQIDHLASSDSRMLALLRLEQRNRSWGPKALRTLGLTPREAEVLYWITEGKTNPEISTILDTTLHTIKKHNNRLFAKLGVETRMAAARLAMSVLTAPAE